MEKKLSEALNLKLLPGNGVEIFDSATSTYKAMLSDIQRAQKSIWIAHFCIIPGREFDPIAKALKEKAAAGIEVKILADQYGSRWLERSYDAIELEAAGVEIVWFQPFDKLRPWRYNHHLHKKLTIIDGAIGYTGGIGIADFWTGRWLEYPEAWRDSHFRMTGPIVGEMKRAFASSWEKFSSTELKVTSTPKGSSQVRMAAIDSTKKWPTLTEIGEQYLAMINSAEKSINITAAYFGPERRVRRALKSAAARGVQVRVLVNGPYTSHRVAHEAGRLHYRSLLMAGVRIYEYQPTKIHCKILTIDGMAASVGSGNLNFRSLHHDDEFNVLIFDSRITAILNRHFEQDLKLSSEILPDEWKARPTSDRIKQRVSGMARHIF